MKFGAFHDTKISILENFDLKVDFWSKIDEPTKLADLQPKIAKTSHKSLNNPKKLKFRATNVCLVYYRITHHY